MIAIIATAVGILIGGITATFASHAKDAMNKTMTSADKLHAAGHPVASDSFDAEAPGVPKNFVFVPLGADLSGQWAIDNDFQASTKPNVLTHKAGSTSGQWDLALWKGAPLADGEITFSVKPVRGDPRFSGGAVWRYQNAQSFYLLEMDSADETLKLYRFKNGKSKCIDTQQALVTEGRWHTVRLDFIAQIYAVYWDGELVMGGHDKTWLVPGAVGLASDAGSQIEFDDWTIRQ